MAVVRHHVGRMILLAFALYSFQKNLINTVLAFVFPPPAEKHVNCSGGWISFKTKKDAGLDPAERWKEEVETWTEEPAADESETKSYGNKSRSNVTQRIRREKVEEKGWSEENQFITLTSYTAGFIPTSIACGFLSDVVGPWNVIFFSKIFSALIGALMRIEFININFICFISTIQGALGGFDNPALIVLIMGWSPPHERGRFCSYMMGEMLGALLSACSMQPLLNRMEWGGIFLVPLGVTFVFIILWILIVSDAPDTHEWISASEREFINNSHQGLLCAHRKWPPFLGILTKMHFWALAVCHAGQMVGYRILEIWTPKYAQSTLGVEVRACNEHKTLPSLLRLCGGFFFGYVGDYTRYKGMTKKFQRKFFIIFSHFIPGLCIISVLFGCKWKIHLMFFEAAAFFSGAVVLTTYVNPMDLSPNYAGTIYGAVDALARMMKFYETTVTKLVTYRQNDLRSYQSLFCFASVTYIATGVVFIMFGHAEMQEYNFTFPYGKQMELEETQGSLSSSSSSSLFDQVVTKRIILLQEPEKIDIQSYASDTYLPKVLSTTVPKKSSMVKTNIELKPSLSRTARRQSLLPREPTTGIRPSMDSSTSSDSRPVLPNSAIMGDSSLKLRSTSARRSAAIPGSTLSPRPSPGGKSFSTGRPSSEPRNYPPPKSSM